MNIDIDKLTEAELIDLNHRIALHAAGARSRNNAPF